jgi:DNA-binding GntR family transcriptional regulator
VITGWHRRILAQTHTAHVYLVNDTSQVYGEHRDILDALRAGSVSQACDALERHLQRSRQTLLDNVRREQTGAETA